MGERGWRVRTEEWCSADLSACWSRAMRHSQCGGDGVHYLGAALPTVKSGACVH